MKVVRLSALRTGRLYPKGHSAAGRIMSMKNSNDTIGNQTCDLPVGSAVPLNQRCSRADGYRISEQYAASISLSKTFLPTYQNTQRLNPGMNLHIWQFV